MTISCEVKLLGIRTLTDIDLKDLKKAFGTMAVSRGRLLTLGEKVMRVSSSHGGDSISGVVLDDNDHHNGPISRCASKEMPASLRADVLAVPLGLANMQQRWC